MVSNTANTLPTGFHAVPLEPGAEGSSIKLCIIVREKVDPVDGHFVPLANRDSSFAQQMAEAKVFLGCMADAGGNVLEWMELWLQSAEGVDPREIDYRDGLNNEILDERWNQRIEALTKTSASGFIQITSHSGSPYPLFIDTSLRKAVHPLNDDSQTYWELCKDNNVLAKAKLPEYSKSMFRYLYVKQEGARSTFVPLSDRAPTNERTQSMETAFGRNATLIPLNPEAGKMAARRFAPIPFIDYVNLLGGKAWQGLVGGLKAFELGGLYEDITIDKRVSHGAGRLFQGIRGWRGNLSETFHLKHLLFHDMILQVREAIKVQQRPLLTIDEECFRVRLPSGSQAFPYLWSRELELTQTGETFLLPVEDADYCYFKLIRELDSNVYRPQEILPLTSSPTGGQLTGQVTLRDFDKVPHTDEVTFFGTLVNNQIRVSDVQDSDLFYLKIPTRLGNVCMFAVMEDERDALQNGRIRFKTLRQRYEPRELEILTKQLQGQELRGVEFEKHRSVRSPADMNALAILGLRVFLVDRKAVIFDVVDHFRQLATEISEQGIPEGRDLPETIRKIVEADEVLLSNLGPHRLISSSRDISPEEALTVVPAQLWYETLALLMRMIPGNPRSFCQDFGDARTYNLELIFDEPLDASEDLVRRSRSLCVVDWTFNREVFGIIQKISQHHDLNY